MWQAFSMEFNSFKQENYNFSKNSQAEQEM